MSFEFRPARRENVPLLLGVAGGTGSGKTMSALRLARGITNGKVFAGIDTENGRMNHYADLFPELRVTQIAAPFRPAKYADAIASAVAYLEAEGIPPHERVVLVDSTSHEWAGDGGCLDWHDELMDGDQKKNLSAWITPKRDHKAMVTRLLQVNAHVILCFRAEPKVESIIEDGKTKIVEKKSITGLDGWIPIAEKNLPYELTASFLLMAERPGIPKPIKLQEQHRPLVPLDAPLSEDVGAALAEWARGGGAEDPAVAAVLELASRVDETAVKKTEKALADHRKKFDGRVDTTWLAKMREALEAKLPAASAEPEAEPEQQESMFKAPAGATSS